ncbi:hypothetical protein [Rhodobacter viridis]|nr:hypothetical protein [Rhodobacter viridis]
MISEDLEERFDKGAEVVDEIISELCATTGMSLVELGNQTFERWIVELSPGIRTHLLPSGGLAYDVEDAVGNQLVGMSGREPFAASIIAEICGSNVYEGCPVPRTLRGAAFQLIHGTFKAAQRTGPKASEDFAMRALLRGLAIFIHQAFDLSLTRYDGPKAMSACDAVSLVAAKHGVSVPFTRLRDWCTHPKHEEFRLRADSLERFMKDLQLVALGIKSQESLYGPFLEFARMRKFGA